MKDHLWATSIIDYCCNSGIDHFFVAPGSRCTPLTLAIARHNNTKVVQHFDERGLAFAALGYGRSTSKPAVFVCTSGTAVANAFPAVIEAATEGVPLLLFTADRPEELHGTGANQTIDQQQIFGNYPELFLQMPVPEDASEFGQLSSCSDQPIQYSSPCEFLTESLSRCFEAATSGPVHVNWMFREPFTIDTDKLQSAEINSAEILSVRPIKSSVENKTPLQIETTGETLIALGSCHPAEAKEALKLSEKLNCPILTDVTSGLSLGSFELPTVFPLPTPDTILHLGGRITSKTWHQWTNQLRDSSTRFIHLTPTGRVVNPNRLSLQMHQTTLADLTDKVEGHSTSDSFRNAWQNAAQRRTRVIDRMLSDAEGLSEPAVANFLSRSCPESGPFFVGNSMPIRDLDWYGTGNSNQPRPTFANRGASGIDGLLATAVGVAVGAQKLTTIVLGDLSALHDLNSLALIANSSTPLIVVIINNQSGHIFDHLPVRKSEHFEQYFATPHAFQFEQAAKMFGLPYQKISTMAKLRESYKVAKEGQSSVVLEISTDRERNKEIRQQIREEINRCQSEH